MQCACWMLADAAVGEGEGGSRGKALEEGFSAEGMVGGTADGGRKEGSP